MRLTSVVANAIMAISAAGTTFAMPGPWSVPQEHFEVLSLRHTVPFNPDAVTSVQCLDREAHIVFHDENAAQLAICDGISGDKTKCRIGSGVTVGKRGSARFTLAALSPRATINMSKVRWEQCVRAARDKCPTGSLSGVCLGAATRGDVSFELDTTLYEEL